MIVSCVSDLALLTKTFHLSLESQREKDIQEQVRRPHRVQVQSPTSRPVSKSGKENLLAVSTLTSRLSQSRPVLSFPHLFDTTAFSRLNVERKSDSRYLPCRISRAKFGAEQLSAESMNKRNDRDVLVTQKKKEKWMQSLMARTRQNWESRRCHTTDCIQFHSSL